MYRITTEQKLRATLEDVWEFFSSPENLQKLMPPDMKFRVLDDLPDRMYEGIMLRYKVAPVWGLEIPWTSEITKIVEGRYFIDVQVEGPFRYWHHQHLFEEHDDGILVKDILHYKLPLEPVSKLFHDLIVGKRLKKIFVERENHLSGILNKSVLNR